MIYKNCNLLYYFLEWRCCSKLKSSLWCLNPPLSLSSFELVYGTIFSHQHRVCHVPGEFLFTWIFQLIGFKIERFAWKEYLSYNLSPNPYPLRHNIIIHRVKTSFMNSPLKFVAFIHRNENLRLQEKNTKRKDYQYIFQCNITLHHHWIGDISDKI